MELLFFNHSSTDITTVSNKIFGILCEDKPHMNNSSNVLGSVYYHITILGIKIRLELNSYGYEEDFAYMIKIDKNPTLDLEVSNKEIESLSIIIAGILSNNLSIKIARELNDELVFFVNGSEL